jgi:ribosome biogenesis GTPase
MRELQLWGDDDGDSDTAAFEDIAALAAQCRFSDCRHQQEPGCAVRDVVPPERLASYHKLVAERAAAAARRPRRR